VVGFGNKSDSLWPMAALVGRDVKKCLHGGELIRFIAEEVNYKPLKTLNFNSRFEIRRPKEIVISLLCNFEFIVLHFNFTELFSHCW
jgi:hypothetical protein